MIFHPLPAHTHAGAASGIASATRHTFRNGMVALIQRNPASPTVSVRGEVRAGAVNERAEQAGLSMFTAAALNRGTQKRSFQQIITETEERGCSVHTGGGTHASGFSGKSLVEDLPLVLEILADMLINPVFPEAEVEKLRNLFLMRLRQYEQETAIQASRAVGAMLYPSEHPYSRPATGTLETIPQLGREDMVAFHQIYHPARTTIAIVGDVEPEQVFAELERCFGDWDVPQSPAVPELPHVSELTNIQRQDIPMAGKAQSDIVWAVHGLKRSDPDFYPALVANTIFGYLGIGGRLGDKVREEQGVAYRISSGFQAGPERGPWAIMAGINPANVEQSIHAILNEIEQFKQDGPTEEELSDARAFLTGSLVIGLEKNGGIASTLLDIETYELGLDYIERYPTLINGVSHDDIIAVARRYLSIEHYVLAVAGPALD